MVMWQRGWKVPIYGVNGLRMGVGIDGVWMTGKCYYFVVVQAVRLGPEGVHEACFIKAKLKGF